MLEIYFREEDRNDSAMLRMKLKEILLSKAKKDKKIIINSLSV